MQDEVVRRAVEAGGEPAQHLAQRLGGGREVRVGRAREVRVVAARDDPHLERRARGVRGERDRVVVGVEQVVRAAHLLPHEPAVRALAFADQEPRGAAELLGDPVRDLGQVVQVEAQVVGPGAGLGAPVLHDLQVLGPGGPTRRADLVAAPLEEALDDRAADRVQRPVLLRRRDDRAPGARPRARRRASPARRWPRARAPPPRSRRP